MNQYKPQAMNFDMVTPTLSRSGLPTESDLKYLRNDLKVQTLINFCKESNILVEEKIAKELGFNYIHLPWSAHFYNILRLKYYWRISEVFLKIVQDPKLHPVHVHCFHGRERTGMMIAIYKIVVEDYNFKEALEDMKRYGFEPQLHFTLVIFIWIFSISHSHKKRQKSMS